MGQWTNPNVQGVQPISQGGQLGGGNIQTITPSQGFNVVNLVNVGNYQSYDLNAYAYALTPGVPSAPITMLIQLLWFDDLTSGIAVFEEQWWVWVGRAATSLADTLVGSGPMHGQYMTVNISIPVQATSNIALQYFNLFGSPRPANWSDWRQDAFEVNPQINAVIVIPPNTSSYENQLATVNSAALTAGSTYIVPIGLYAGPVYCRFQAGSAPQNAVCIASAENIVGGQAVAGTNTPNIISSAFGLDANNHEVQVQFPRSVCYIIIHANATTGGNVSCSFTGQQAA